MLKDDIALKVNRLTIGIATIFALILLRVLYLTIIQHDMHVEQSKKPQYKTVIEPAKRGTIRDRNHMALAVNQLQYNIAVLFDEIRTIPKIKWIKAQGRSKKKHFARKQYITDLSHLLGALLELDPLFVEDTIYARASIFPTTPFVIKEGISERLYYRLRMLEKQWPGLKAQIASKRFYPQGKLACSVIGYMGAINASEHIRISQQIQSLQAYLQSREEGLAIALPTGFDSVEEVKQKLYELKEKSYSINTQVGKTGIEKQFDAELRGYYGKKNFEVDTKGHIVRELPDSYHASPGQRFTLNIDARMQAYAEKLLAENEALRDQRFRLAGKNHNLVHPPWIKGGAIVVMEPKTGAILTFASYPGFDPNDFIYSGSAEEKQKKQARIHQWLETPHYIGQIWDGKRPLEREIFCSSKQTMLLQTQWLDWNTYLDMVLSENSSVKKILLSMQTVDQMINIQRAYHQLIALCDEAPLATILNHLYTGDTHTPSHIVTDIITRQYTLDRINTSLDAINALKSQLDPYLEQIQHNDDKLLFCDLCALLIPYESLKTLSSRAFNNLSPSQFRAFSQTFSSIEDRIIPDLKKAFHSMYFSHWRNQEFPKYLKAKRKEEKKAKRYQRPYIEYLEEKEQQLFSEFYQRHKSIFIETFLSLHPQYPSELAPYVHMCKKLTFDSQNQTENFFQLRQFLCSLSFDEAVHFIQSLKSFKDLNKPLHGRYALRKTVSGEQSLRELAMHFYPITGFGYSRSYAFQESAPQGSIFKIVTALEAIKQKYKGNQTKHLNPMTIIDCSNPRNKESRKQILGYHLDGRKIQRHYRGGRLPASLKNVGKIDLLAAFENSSNIYFSLLTEEVIKKPADLTKLSSNLHFGKKTGLDLPGEIPGILPTDIIDNQTGLYAFAIGQHSLVVTPLQTAVMMSAITNGGNVFKPQIVQQSTSLEHSHHRNLSRKTYPYKDYINLVGLDFPFFSETVEKEKKPLIIKHTPHVLNHLNMPKEVKNYLLQGLYRVVNGPKGSARTSAILSLVGSYRDKHSYNQIKRSMVGKSATAEILYRPCLDRQFKPIICKHIWFSSASFQTHPQTSEIDFDQPEIVCIVYLRFGDFGKEAAPIAAKMIEKYREISRQKN